MAAQWVAAAHPPSARLSGASVYLCRVVIWWHKPIDSAHELRKGTAASCRFAPSPRLLSFVSDVASTMTRKRQQHTEKLAVFIVCCRKCHVRRPGSRFWHASPLQTFFNFMLELLSSIWVSDYLEKAQKYENFKVNKVTGYINLGIMCIKINVNVKQQYIQSFNSEIKATKRQFRKIVIRFIVSAPVKTNQTD